jgi:hypothetical protein
LEAALARIIAALEAAGIPEMLAGSFASTFHGEPRTTQDIDFVIDLASDWKIDLILRKERLFSRSEFDRRMPALIPGVAVHIATAEDTILAKLEWAQLGESERQLRDVVGVIELCSESLDRAYIERWAHELGVETSWQWARAEAER